MRTTYDKLVRDLVPQAIAADGHTYHVDVLSTADFHSALKRKLVEEAEEAFGTSTNDELLLELADLMEVIVALSDASGISRETLEKARLERRSNRGGFEKRLLLHYVERADLPSEGSC